MRELIRTKWAAVGAAVAVSLGAGGISMTQAAISSGEKPVYVALSSPCRLVDTRPAAGPIGVKGTPIAAGETNAYEIQVTGDSGNCTGGLKVPADAVGVALNVTAIAPSAPTTGRSFFTVYPGDASLPNTSNLNFLDGQAPVPNKVDVGLSATGTIKIFNNEGSSHAAVDVFGYYVDHNHDDRYYTEAEVDTAIGAVETNVATVASDVNNATRVHFARVAGNGTVQKTSNQKITVAKTATGNYTITLPEAADNCAVETSLYGRGEGLGYVLLGLGYSLEAYSFAIHDTAGPANEVDVFVRIYDDSAGDQTAVPSDLPFSVTAYCSDPVFVFVPGITIPPIIIGP